MTSWAALKPYAREITLPPEERSLFLYDAGPKDAPVVVLIHGLGDEADSWRHVVDPLAEHQRVLAPDLPGFGRSASLDHYAIEGHINAVMAMLDTLGIERATLIGNSLGGVLAHAIPLRHPERVRGTVLIGGVLYAAGQHFDLSLLLFLIPGLGEWLYSRLRHDLEAAYDSLRPYYADLDALPEADRDFLFRRVNARVRSERQRRAYLGTLRHMITWLPKQQQGLKDQLAELDVPTLVVFGKEDAITDPKSGEALLDVQPSARFLTIPNAGHVVQQERPEALLDVIYRDARLDIR
jgi:pimeloyl-ACP methyl ester carboxylesterase